MIIDAHVHLYPPEINADPAGWARRNNEPQWGLLATRVRRNGRRVQSFPSASELLKALDGAGVDRAVLQGWYWHRHDACARQNAFYAECLRQHPDRLAAAVTVFPPAGWDHVHTELTKARDAGFQGIGELSPHAQGYAVDHPVFSEMVRVAGDWRWPVNLHVTAPDARPYPGMVPTPLADFAALAGRFPQTVLVLAHFGGMESDEANGGGGDASGGDSAPPQLSSPLIQGPNIYYDSAAAPLSYDSSIWRRMPAGRVLFGSDFPLNLYPGLDSEPDLRRFVEGTRRDSGLPAGELAAVLGGTAKRWFAVKAAI
jgi:hypothetical protein